MFSRRRGTTSSGYGQSITGKIGSSSASTTPSYRARDTRRTYTPDSSADDYMSKFRSSRTLSSASRTNLYSTHQQRASTTTNPNRDRAGASSTSRASSSSSSSSRSSSSSASNRVSLFRRRKNALDSLTDEVDSLKLGTSRYFKPSSAAATAPSSSSSSSRKSTTSTTSTTSTSKLCCDKCDGNHETERCPYYRKKRGTHPDEKKGKGKGLGAGSGGSFFIKSARVVRQPGDGSCLFHSLAYGLRGASAGALRRSIAVRYKNFS